MSLESIILLDEDIDKWKELEIHNVYINDPQLEVMNELYLHFSTPTPDATVLPEAPSIEGESELVLGTAGPCQSNITPEGPESTDEAMSGWDSPLSSISESTRSTPASISHLKRSAPASSVKGVLKRTKLGTATSIFLHNFFLICVSDTDEDEIPYAGWTPENADDEIPGSGVVGNFLIRAEYIRIYEACVQVLKKPKKRLQRASFFFITGQPGIGKTWWATYAAARCLYENRPFLWFRPSEEPLLFTSDGVFELPKKWLKTIRRDANLWTFFDAECETNLMMLLPLRTPLVVFFTTSPSQKYRWNRIEKDTDSRLMVMNPWTRNEILKAAPLYDASVEEVTARYDKYGPSARICLEATDDAYEHYKRRVEAAFDDLLLSTETSIKKLKQLVDAAKECSVNPDGISHVICLMTRRTLDISDKFELSPISDHIWSELTKVLRRTKLSARIDLYLKLGGIPASRRMAGVLWESIVHDQFSNKIDLQCVRMVNLAEAESDEAPVKAKPAKAKPTKASTAKPAKGKSKRDDSDEDATETVTGGRHPRWHSCHEPIENSALEKLRLAALEEAFSVSIETGGVEEYSALSPPSLRDEVLHLPQSISEAAVDSFIISHGVLYLFQITIAKTHTINRRLIDLAKKYKFPDQETWRFIFILPENHTLIVPQAPELAEVALYTAQFSTEICL